MTETTQNCNKEKYDCYELLKKLNDFSSDIELQENTEYKTDVFYDTKTNTDTEPAMNDEEFFKLFE